MSIRWTCLIPLVFFLSACEEQPAIPPEHLQDQESPGEEAQYTPGTLEAEKMRQARGAELTVGEAVRGFRVIHGNYPETLDALVADGPLNELPDLPEGYRYEYDAQEGEVQVVKIDE